MVGERKYGRSAAEIDDEREQEAMKQIEEYPLQPKKKLWGTLAMWQKGVAAIVFFVALSFIVSKTFVLAGDFLQFVQQEETNWLIVDRRDYEDRILALEQEWKNQEMPPVTMKEYWRMKNELDFIYDELDARRKERRK